MMLPKIKKGKISIPLPPLEGKTYKIPLQVPKGEEKSIKIPLQVSKSASERLVKTTVELPHDLWKAAKVRAIDEGTDLRAVIISALKKYLKN